MHVEVARRLRHRHARSLTSLTASSLNSRLNCRLVPISTSGFASHLNKVSLKRSSSMSRKLHDPLSLFFVHAAFDILEQTSIVRSNGVRLPPSLLCRPVVDVRLRLADRNTEDSTSAEGRPRTRYQSGAT